MRAVLLVLFLIVVPKTSFAAWSWGVGYNNPPGATVGLNFMHLWNEFAIEFGIGWVDVDQLDSNNSGNTDTTQVSIAGDFNMKYLFGSGTFRPYVQGGFGLGSGLAFGDGGGASVGTGSGFFGGGFFMMAQAFYFYASYNLVGTGSNGALQAGLGFDF